MTVAQKLHIGQSAKYRIEDELLEAFEEFEPEIYNLPDFGFEIGSDDYDNSLEIYFDISIPYPYEPCKEIRELAFSYGFSQVYWNFKHDTEMVETDRVFPKPNGLVESYDEIRGWEPRHGRSHHWESTKYGYVDYRFNEEEWKSKYNFKNK